MCRTTFVAHAVHFSDTQETLAVIESLDIDNETLTEEETAKKFGWEDDYYNGSLNWWQRIKPKLWSLFDDPYSSSSARVGVVV